MGKRRAQAPASKERAWLERFHGMRAKAALFVFVAVSTVSAAAWPCPMTWCPPADGPPTSAADEILAARECDAVAAEASSLLLSPRELRIVRLGSVWRDMTEARDQATRHRVRAGHVRHAAPRILRFRFAKVKQQA
jgi:hypothetical protein